MYPRILLTAALLIGLTSNIASAQILGNAPAGNASDYVPKVHVISLGQAQSTAAPAAIVAKPVSISCDLDQDPISNLKAQLEPTVRALSKKTEDQFVKDSVGYVEVRVREPWKIERTEGQTETLFPGNPNCGVAYPSTQKDDLDLVVQNNYSSPTIAGQDRRRSFHDMPTSYGVCKVNEEAGRTLMYLKTNAYAHECDVSSFHLFCNKKEGKPTTIADFNEGTSANFLRMGYKLH